MTTPRVEIDLAKLRHNARTLVEWLERRGIAVVGVTKAVLGSPDVANALLRGGVGALGDSRIENIEHLRHAGVTSPITLIRSPMLSQAAQVVEHADTSLNSELVVIEELSSVAAARHRVHGVILMVELGDLREGIMPADLDDVVRVVLSLPGIELQGIGTNLACQSGVIPTAENMAELSALTESVESSFGIRLDVISGGNSANLDWALHNLPIEEAPSGQASIDDTRLDDTPPAPAARGRVNQLRIGEALLLGREPTRRTPIAGLHTDAFVVVAEIIEVKTKPSMPRGSLAQNAMGEQPVFVNEGPRHQALLAIGEQDVDPSGLQPPTGFTIIGASSDHLVVDCGNKEPSIGTTISFAPTYGALSRAMASPFVTTIFANEIEARPLSLVPEAD